MEKTKFFSFLVVYCAILFALSFGSPDAACDVRYADSGQITSRGWYMGSDCWELRVPMHSFIILDIYDLSFIGLSCSSTYLEISSLYGKNEVYNYCAWNLTKGEVILMYSETYIRFVYYAVDSKGSPEFSLKYKAFPYSILPEVIEFREAATTWLLNHRSPSYGWGEDTHRAITALYLSGNASFQNSNLEGDMMIQKLEHEAADTILRYSTNPPSVSDLSMLINALLVTCHSPSNFSSHNLLELLAERMDSSTSLNPGAYLTLCIANETLPMQETKKLFKSLENSSKYPIELDNQALTIMAIACAKKRGYDLSVFPESDKLFNASVSSLISDQQPDGSYGNLYTTALVAQALLASNQVYNLTWNWNATLVYLMKEVNLTRDLLSISLTLPLFMQKTILDIPSVNCTKPKGEISDIMERPGKRMLVKFSLHVDDQSDVIRTLYLKVPKTISALEVLRVAQETDPKCRFHYGNFSGNVYVYEIAGKTNDAQEQKYWLLYTENIRQNKSVTPMSQSLDKYFVSEGDHLILLYKKVHVGANNIFPDLWSTVSPLTTDNLGRRNSGHLTRNH